MAMPLRLWARLFCSEAIHALARHKMRTGLTALGVMVGVSAVIWVVAIGQAGMERTEAELQKLGNNLIWIEAGSRNINGVRNGTYGTTTLTPEDAEAIRREVPLIVSVSENTDGTLQAVYRNRNWFTHYRGVSPEYTGIKLWQVAEGSFFTRDQVQHIESVAVIGETVRRELFGASNPIGEVLRIQGSLFKVVGVLTAKGSSGWGQDQDDIIMMPWTTALKKIGGQGITWLDDIVCSAASREAVNPAIEAVTALIRQRHHIRPGEPDDFNIRRPDEVIKAQIRQSRTLEWLLTSIASISLLVGGIGIMNVMLASVAQRTAEIGLRVAVGATPWAVQIQFLGEAVMLSLFGGVLGVLLSFVGDFFIEGILGWPLSTSPQGALLAVLFAVAVGVFFGFYPAWRASRLDPIAALRNE
ncbi:MAG TPA: ABC transporter permease [Nitrospiria bacterium]|jgi:putative ABC transport system permease protein|nr:ABC transporter permease [Nitrospiria bacterium]